jgi:hypothetical protein
MGKQAVKQAGSKDRTERGKLNIPQFIKSKGFGSKERVPTQDEPASCKDESLLTSLEDLRTNKATSFLDGTSFLSAKKQTET